MTTVHALALRRAATAAGVLAVTLAAHAQGDGVRIDRTAPVMWAALIVLATLLGPRTGSFRPRGPVVFLVLLLALQLASHVAMAVAPWAFGLSEHHGVPLLTPGVLAGHVAAALLLAVLLARADRVIARLVAMAVAHARRALSPLPAGPRTTVVPGPGRIAPASVRPRRAHLTRGPPLPAG